MGLNIAPVLHLAAERRYGSSCGGGGVGRRVHAEIVDVQRERPRRADAGAHGRRDEDIAVVRDVEGAVGEVAARRVRGAAAPVVLRRDHGEHGAHRPAQISN